MTASYAYDPLGNQISQTVNDVTTNFQIDPTGLGNVVAAYDSSGDLLTHYTYGIGLVSQVSAAGIAGYYDFNNIGSTVGITGTSGSYINAYAYLPFGQTITIAATGSNAFTFVGQLGVQTGGTGLLDMRTRSYDPTTGQFISRDPIGLFGGDPNLQRYATDNPVNSIDPTGQATMVTMYATNDYDLPQKYLTLFEEAVGEELSSSDAGPNGYLAFRNGTLLAGKLTVQVGSITRVLQFNTTREAPNGTRTAIIFRIRSTNRYPVISTAIPQTPGLALVAKSAARANARLPIPQYHLVTPAPVAKFPSVAPTTPTAFSVPRAMGTRTSSRPTRSCPTQSIFENEPTALPAQGVTITQQFDTSFDWNSFRLSSFGFDGMTFTVPSDSSFYQATLDLSQTLGYDVQVAATINELTGVATWTFTTIDPSTGEVPTDPTIGFLPPDNAEGAGEGFVSYTIMASPSDTDGTLIPAQATVVFQTQPPLNTPQIFNTIGSEGPTVSLTASALDFTTNSFTLSWTGQDDVNGPGIADYNIYVSTNGGAYTSYLQGTTLTQATFTGQAGDSYAFYAVAVDNVGTSSDPSATVQVLLVPPPTQPAPPALVPADDSGIQGDGITDNDSPSLFGTTQADATVQLLNSSDAVVATTQADDNGNYDFPVPGAPLSLGTYVFSVLASNVNGSSPASNAFTLTIVAVPVTPSAPTLLPADDSGTQGDNTTDDTSPSLTGTTFAGASIQLLDINDNVIATTIADTSGNYAIPIPGPLAVGTYQYSVETIDLYGDVSSPSSAYSLTIIASPTTPIAPTLLPADDSGTQGDNTTDDTSPSLTGTTFAGATVQLLDINDNVVATTTADTSGNYVIPIPGPLAVGTYQYSIQTTDSYGDVSSPSSSYSLTIVAAPTTPSAPTLLPADDSGTQGDKITDDASPSLTGTAFAGATVQLLDVNDNVLATAAADTSGNYVIPIPGPLAVGTYQYSIETTDPYGDDSSPSPAYSLTIVAAPTTPSASTLLAADDSGTQGDKTTDDANPSLAGATFAGATVQLLDVNDNVIATTTADTSGNYVIPIPGPLAVGTYQYSIQTTDQYGDVSSPSGTYSLTIVATPTTPSAPALLPADDSGTQGDKTTDDASPSLAGTTFAGATVQLLDVNDDLIATVTADTSGNYVIPIPGPLAIGTYQYGIQTTDPYGDVSSPSPSYSLTIVAAPATPSATHPLAR